MLEPRQREFPDEIASLQALRAGVEARGGRLDTDKEVKGWTLRLPAKPALQVRLTGDLTFPLALRLVGGEYWSALPASEQPEEAAQVLSDWAATWVVQRSLLDILREKSPSGWEAGTRDERAMTFSRIEQIHKSWPAQVEAAAEGSQVVISASLPLPELSELCRLAVDDAIVKNSGRVVGLGLVTGEPTDLRLVFRLATPACILTLERLEDAIQAVCEGYLKSARGIRALAEQAWLSRAYLSWQTQPHSISLLGG